MALPFPKIVADMQAERTARLKRGVPRNTLGPYYVSRWEAAQLRDWSHAAMPPTRLFGMDVVVSYSDPADPDVVAPARGVGSQPRWRQHPALQLYTWGRVEQPEPRFTVPYFNQLSSCMSHAARTYWSSLLGPTRPLHEIRELLASEEVDHRDAYFEGM